MVLRKSFYIRWSAGRSPRVHEVNPGWDPSLAVRGKILRLGASSLQSTANEWGLSDQVPARG